MKEKTKTLKPCPFCGAKVDIRPGVVAGISMIVCGSCGATVSFARKTTPERTTAAWNRRCRK